MSLLGSLLCFPNHFDSIPVLQPDQHDLVVISCPDVKVRLKFPVFLSGLSSVSFLILQHFAALDVPSPCLQCFDAVGWAAGRASGP